MQACLQKLETAALYKKRNRARGVQRMPRVRGAFARTKNNNISGGDALMGHTRTHPEHDG